MMVLNKIRNLCNGINKNQSPLHQRNKSALALANISAHVLENFLGNYELTESGVYGGCLWKW